MQQSIASTEAEGRRDEHSPPEWDAGSQTGQFCEDKRRCASPKSYGWTGRTASSPCSTLSWNHTCSSFLWTSVPCTNPAWASGHTTTTQAKAQHLLLEAATIHTHGGLHDKSLPVPNKSHSSAEQQQSFERRRKKKKIGAQSSSMKSNRLYTLPWRILSLFTSGHTLMHNALTVTHENNVSVTSEPFEQNVGHKRSEMEFLYCSTAAVWLCFSPSRLNHFCSEQSLHSAWHAGGVMDPLGWEAPHTSPEGSSTPPFLPTPCTSH